MRYICLIIVYLSLISCQSDSDDNIQPKVIPNIGYQVEGSPQQIKLTYTNLEGDRITEISSIPWKKTYGSITLAPGEDLNTNFRVSSLSQEKEGLKVYILNNNNSYSSSEIQNGQNLSIDLSNRFFHPNTKYLSSTNFYQNMSGPSMYSVTGTEQIAIISYRNIDNIMVTDTLDLPWEKGFHVNLDPGESFKAVLNVQSFSEDQETINASIRDIEETKTGTDLEINLSNTIPSRFTPHN